MTPLRTFRIALWVAVAVLAAGLVFLVVDGQRGGSSLTAATIGGPFSLVDQKGAPVTEAALKGHPSAMFFGYTFCPDVCPTTMSDLTLLMEKLGPDADKLKVYFVTVDPERDTQEQLGEYLQAFDPRFTALTGSPQAIEAMLKEYRVYSKKIPVDGGAYTMDHTASVYLLDGDGKLAGTLDYHEPEETALAKLKRLIGGA